MSGTTSEYLDIDAPAFERVRGLLRTKAGIELADNRQSLVVARLMRRVKSLGFTTFDPYLDLVERDECESGQFVNALTTNVTDFFRERHHFELLEGIARQAKRNEPFTVWSSACSSGQEPWSIAMTLDSTTGAPPTWKVLATDIDADVLARAQEGVYSVDQTKAVGAELQANCFSHDRTREFLRIRNELRSKVFFAQLNLLGAWPMKGLFDVIFCRNVLIYFSPENRVKTVRRLAGLLKPGGVLMLGHSEAVLGTQTELVSIGKTAFQRASGVRPS
ncbi:MAG: protein-glutamate O-methyltransferase CheR [Archangiaceae bacterium]|nr:protein-glutamate O-methyltransferase CheR [Archangiaceae bacterium]